MSTSVIEITPPTEPRVLRPSKHRVRVVDVWTSRHVARMIGVRDIKIKYKQAALGPLWLLIAPLGMLAAITIAFSGVTDVQTSGIPYLLFALAGLAVWTFVQLSLTLGTQAIVSNAPLIRRSPLPRIALLSGSILGNLPPFLVLLTFTVVGAAVTGHLPLQAVLLPFFIVWLALFTFGTMLLLSSLSARYRDTAAAIPLIIQAGIFVSPVGYSLAGSPSNIHLFLVLNPVSGLIEGWRWCLLNLPDPSVAAIINSLVWTVLLMVAGWRVFGRMEVDFADYV